MHFIRSWYIKGPLHSTTSFNITLNGIKSIRVINSLNRERKKNERLRNGAKEE